MVSTNQDCTDYGGDWVNKVQNFDHVLNGMGILFQMVTTEGWVDVLYRMVDAAGENKNPIPGKNPLWSYFAMALIIVSNFLILNFFAGVLMDTFSSEKNKIGGLDQLSNSQKQWIELQSFILSQKVKAQLQRPKTKIRRLLFEFWESKTWHFMNVLLVLTSSIAHLLVYHRQNESFSRALLVIQFVTYSFYLIEVVLKVITYSKSAFKDPVLIMDMILLLTETVNTY